MNAVNQNMERLLGLERAILVDTPYCTPKEYARRSGLSYPSVKQRIDRGELPVYRPEDGRSVFINMMALANQALEEGGK